jgi:hypothetical protein
VRPPKEVLVVNLTPNGGRFDDAYTRRAPSDAFDRTIWLTMGMATGFLGIVCFCRTLADPSVGWQGGRSGSEPHSADVRMGAHQHVYGEHSHRSCRQGMTARPAISATAEVTYTLACSRSRRAYASKIKLVSEFATSGPGGEASKAWSR